MTSYAAPLQDMRFVLQEIADLPSLATLPVRSIVPSRLPSRAPPMVRTIRAIRGRGGRLR